MCSTTELLLRMWTHAHTRTRYFFKVKKNIVQEPLKQNICENVLFTCSWFWCPQPVSPAPRWSKTVLIYIAKLTGLLAFATDSLLQRSVTDHVTLGKKLFHITCKWYLGIHHIIHAFKLTATAMGKSTHNFLQRSLFPKIASPSFSCGEICELLSHPFSICKIIPVPRFTALYE